jgi:hypothetical protein
MHLDVARLRLADDEGAHQGGVVVPVDPGELQRQLVGCRQLAAAGLVAAQQRVRPGPDDELVGRIVAAAGEHRRLLGGENVALVGAGPGRLDGRDERGIAEARRFTHIFEFGGRLDGAQAAHQVRRPPRAGRSRRARHRRPCR